MIWLLLLGTAMATEKGNIDVAPTVDLWVAGQQTTGFAVNADGLEGGQDDHINGRQLVGLKVSSDNIGIHAGVDVLQHQMMGSTWDISDSIDERNRDEEGRVRVVLRDLHVTSNLPIAQLQTGFTTSHWGLGMVANNGSQDPFFGLPEFGDRVIRARITTQPIPAGNLFLSGAVDRILQDEQVSDPSRQWAQQAVLSLLWKDDQSAAGVYGATRRQDELDHGRTTKVGVLDAFLDVQRPIQEGIDLRFAVEVAGISGKTNRSTSYSSPDRLNIRSLGAAFESMIDASWFGLGAAGAYASGDRDPSDDELNDFGFDRNYGVGMVLFDEVSGGIEAATHRELVNPEHAGRPPSGVDSTVTEGAFRRASYIQPRLELRPLSWLNLRVGHLFAWSTAPVSQPFYTVRNGGVPQNHLQQSTHGYRLGQELDLSIKADPLRDQALGKNGVAPSLAVQFGRAFLSENWGGQTVDRTLIVLRVD